MALLMAVKREDVSGREAVKRFFGFRRCPVQDFEVPEVAIHHVVVAIRFADIWGHTPISSNYLNDKRTITPLSSSLFFRVFDVRAAAAAAREPRSCAGPAARLDERPSTPAPRGCPRTGRFSLGRQR